MAHGLSNKLAAIQPAPPRVVVAYPHHTRKDVRTYKSYERSREFRNLVALGLVRWGKAIKKGLK